MRIGILTLPLHTNFGGILQAYALQTVIERMGHEVYVISIKQRPFSFPQWKRPIVYLYRLLQRLRGSKVDILIDRKINHDMPIIEQNTKKFIDRYIKQWKIDDLRNLKEDTFDAIIVGSDQIWRKSYFESTYYTKYADAFLDFAKEWKIKKIAYACSFGFDKWEYDANETEQIKNLLLKFDVVSVREESAVGICKKVLGIEAKHVLDPTLLLDSKDYLKLVEENEPCRNLDGDMMVYVLDNTEENREKIDNITKERGLTPFFFDAKIDDPGAPTNERVQYSVNDWLVGFQKAKLVVTDSFHACVFSILFHKPFIVLKNNTRGNTRLISLLRQLDIKGNESEVNCVLRCEDDTNNMNLLRIKSITIILDSLAR